MSFQNCRVEGKDVDARAYHAMKESAARGSKEFVMSPSALKAFAVLPSRWIRGWSPPDTKAKAWGNLVDCRTLTPQLFSGRYAIEPETYPSFVMRCPSCGSETDSKSCRKCGCERESVTVAKPWRYGAAIPDEWREAQLVNGLEIVGPDDITNCDAAVRRLFEPVEGDDTIKRWFDACDRQVLVRGEWRDDTTGLVVPVSALLDFVPRVDSEFSDCLGDFKSTMSGHPFKFTKQAFSYGYHIQAAFDLDIYRAATGEERTTWCFILQENFEPWETNRAMYGQEAGMGQPGFIELGRDGSGYRAMLENYCKCLTSDIWPAYNANDEAVQGWCVLRPFPFMAGEELFKMRFDFDAPEEMPHLHPTTTPLAALSQREMDVSMP